MKKNSKKISKIIAPVALATGCLAAVPATSCSMYSNVKHIAPYLHEITFDDYTYDSEFITTQSAEAFGCSSVRRGNFYGRNFDYVFNDTPEFVVRVKENKEKGRHASIGMATHFGLRESKLLNGDYNKQLELVPNITLDGINDAGVICSHNVVSMEPDDIDPVTKEAAVKAETQPDNKNAFQLHQLFVPRYVLDNAASVDEAITLLKSKDLNIKGDLSGTHHLHIMIADKTKTAVVEFFDAENEGHFQVIVDEKKENSDKQYGLPIMTNFYINKSHDPSAADYYFDNDERNGVERYEILRDGYNKVKSFADMEELMKKVMFSNSYRYAHNPVPYDRTLKLTSDPESDTLDGDLTSEWYSESFTQTEIDKVAPKDGTGLISDLEPITQVFDKLKQDYWITRMMDFRNPPNPKFWQTTHNSTYDMENKHLRIVVQEQYEIYYDYYL